MAFNKFNQQGKQQSSRQTSSSSISNYSRGPQAPPPQTEFLSHEDFEFYRLSNTSYRLSVLTIESQPYVGISHWWFNRTAAQWFPSRKQIFLPKSAWFGLLEQAERATSALEPLKEDPFPSQG